MFMQIHFLTSYHASLLNRDDAGLAKRIPFGGADRLRVSSQCQKRHWRVWMMEDNHLPSAIRSRHFFERELKPRLIDGGMDEQQAHELLLVLAKNIFTTAGEKDAIDKDTLQMKQPVLFGCPEADYLTSLVEEAAQQEEPEKWLTDRIKETKKNVKAMLRETGLKQPAAGFEGAMFGRFVTSDLLSRVDAPVHVAHAFTTHALDTEVDYFTVVDDLLTSDETGAAHANDAELGAGIFYGYVAIDIPLLVSNLRGCERNEWQSRDNTDARQLLDQLVHAIATVTPGAKLGATAPYASAEHVLIEVGKDQPRSLANAYLKPVSLDGQQNPVQQSVDAMSDYLSRLEKMYGQGDLQRFVASLHGWRNNEPTLPLGEATDKTLTTVFGAAP